MSLKFKYYIFFVIFFILGLQSFFADEQDYVEPTIFPSTDDVIYLNSGWMFVLDDKMSNRNWTIEQSKWYPISPTDPWQFKLPEASNRYENSWYSLPFKMDEINEIDSFGLSLPFGYDAFQIYLNGIFIYESASFENNVNGGVHGSKPMLISLPMNLIKEDINHLNLRVSSFSGVGGFAGPLYMGSYFKLQKRWVRILIKDIAIGFISLFLFAFFLIRYFFRKKDQYNLVFSIFSLSVGLFVIGFSGLWLYLFDSAWAYWIPTFLGGINMYLMPILFIHSFFNMKLGKIAKIFSGFYILMNLFVVIEFIVSGQLFYFNKYVYLIFNLSYIFLVIYLFFVSINTVRKKLLYSKMMFVSFVFLAISFVYSMLSFAVIINRAPLIGEGFFVMMVFYSIILAKRFSQTHEDLEITHEINIELNKNLEEKVETRTAELRNKNEEIMQSIEYAGIILSSTLPKEEDLNKIFSDHFVIWRPKDIVGGDFYWSHHDGDDSIFALADCTGHGVPGALLSMAASSALRRIAIHINHDSPSKILNQLNIIMKKNLSQGTVADISDNGLDIGLCHYSKKTKKLTYAGSRIRLYHYTDKEGLVEVRGNRQGVGFKRSMDSYNYNSYTFDVSESSTFYLTTDGYLDQGGGEREFCFGWTRYTKALIEMQYKSFIEQKKHMERILDEFSDGSNQRDDITVVGFKVITE